MDFAGEPTR